MRFDAISVKKNQSIVIETFRSTNLSNLATLYSRFLARTGSLWKLERKKNQEKWQIFRNWERL